MSLITFRDKNTSGDPVGPTWYLQFDALVLEDFSRSAEVTVYPIETGAMLSDHYQPLPREITLTGTVSDTPSGHWTNIEGMQNAAKPMSMVERTLWLQTNPDQRQAGPAGILRPISTSILPGRRVIQSNVERARNYIPKKALTLQRSDGSPDPVSNTFSEARTTANRVASFASILDGIMESKTFVSVILQTGAEYTNMMITEHRAPRAAGSSGAITFTIDMREIVLADAAVSKKPGATRPEPKLKAKKPKGGKGKKIVKTGTIEENRINKTGIGNPKSLILQLGGS